MKILKPSAEPLDWKKSFLCLVLTVACFHLAYTSLKFPALGLFIFGYAYFLVQLINQSTVRRAFYFGLATGFLCAAPQAFFFWGIFGPAAIVLWIVFGFWIGLFAAISCGCIRRWGWLKAMWLIPIIWTGLEYFRSELYYLKFSWLNIGYALPNLEYIQFDIFGMYGCGFLVFAIIVILTCRHLLKRFWIELCGVILALLILLSMFFEFIAAARYEQPYQPLSIVGIQMEFPPENIIPKMLNQALAKNTNAQIFVLSECTLDGGVPNSLKNWCRENQRFLVVGGKDIVTNHIYYNTAFVVGTNGEIVFKQAKSVPVQFFDDGLPATKQEVWNSPWGKIGICICYDLSYTRVTDKLVEEGAKLLIVPTMDVAEWGRHEHELHSRVAPVRATEYGIPIFRLTSSGISQVVTRGGYFNSQTPFGGVGDILSAKLKLPMCGARPLDRFFAPICVGITDIITAVLLFLTWKDKRLNGKQTTP